MDALKQDNHPFSNIRMQFREIRIPLSKKRDPISKKRSTSARHGCTSARQEFPPFSKHKDALQQHKYII